jgi:hypothetical protein
MAEIKTALERDQAGGGMGNAKAAADPKDPWQHRAAGMRCATCMSYVRKVPSLNIGRCRRHAPTMSGFPVVYDIDWCGDHKLNESATS